MSLGVGSSSFDPPPRLPPPPRRAAGRDESRSGSGNRYEDVTELFKQSCSSECDPRPRITVDNVISSDSLFLAGLALGQMVHPASFTLLDSMACISIGDPRMDSGVYPLPRDLIPESDRIATSSQTLTFNPHKALDVDETTWIIDRLASCHVAFHGGAPLSQTLYTSLYFHHLNSIPGDDSDPQHLYTQILRAYLVATIKCFGLAWQELVAGNLIEGEDTITDTCQISLYEEMPVGYAIGELQRGIAALKTVEQQEALERKGKGISGLILRLSIVKVRVVRSAASSHANTPLTSVPSPLLCAELHHDLHPLPGNTIESKSPPRNSPPTLHRIPTNQQPLRPDVQTARPPHTVGSRPGPRSISSRCVLVRPALRPPSGKRRGRASSTR